MGDSKGRYVRRWLCIFSLSIPLTACGESVLPTSPSTAGSISRSMQDKMGMRTGGGFSCEVRTRVAAGERTRAGGRAPVDVEGARRPAWRAGRGSVRFDASDLARDGGTMYYHFRGYEDGTTLVSTADCVIPRSDRAIRRMNAAFGVPEASASGRGSRTPASPRFGDTQCVESTCVLQNLYVSACSWGGIWPHCYNRPQASAGVQCGAMDPSCGGWGGGDDPWAWDGGGGGGDPFSADTTRPCATEYPLLNDSVVQVKFAEAWAASGYGAPMEQRREQGGWIVRTAAGQLTAEAFPATWRSTPCGIDLPAGAAAPAGALAMYHTHPFTRGEQLTACDPQDLPGGRKAFINYRNESSIADDSVLTRFRQAGATNLIGIILDADKITAYDGSGVNQRAVDRCGY